METEMETPQEQEQIDTYIDDMFQEQELQDLERDFGFSWCRL